MGRVFLQKGGFSWDLKDKEEYPKKGRRGKNFVGKCRALKWERRTEEAPGRRIPERQGEVVSRWLEEETEAQS